MGSGYFADYWNTLTANRIRVNGGLYFACKEKFAIIWEHHHVFKYCVGEEGMGKSVSFVLLDVDQYWPGKYLLIINTHLHSPFPFSNTEARKTQKEEILKGMQVIQKVMSYPDDFKWENCGVLMLGDFNMAYKIKNSDIPTKEYQETGNFS